MPQVPVLVHGGNLVGCRLVYRHQYWSVEVNSGAAGLPSKFAYG